MRTLSLSLLCLLAIAPAALPLAVWLDLETALRDADLIARVRVISVSPAPADSGFKHIARVTVIDTAKGSKLGESVDLLSDNGLTCPNVLYAVGDDCIVFAKRRKNGHFETMNAYAGQFRVENGSAEFYLPSRLSPPLWEHGSTEQILAELKRKIPAAEIMADLRRRLSNTSK